MFHFARKAAGAAVFALAAAVVAALIAHVAIDAVGDVALARDAYDGIAHESRGFLALALVAALGFAGYQFLMAALGGAAARDRVSRALWTPASPFGFLAAVVVATVGLLFAMEAVDSLLAGRGLTSVADALGGSPKLGLELAVPIAAALGWLAWRVLSWFAATHRDLLRSIEAILIGLLPAHAPSVRMVASPVRISRPSAVLRRAAKRGPPPILSR